MFFQYWYNVCYVAWAKGRLVSSVDPCRFCKCCSLAISRMKGCGPGPFMALLQYFFLQSQKKMEVFLLHGDSIKFFYPVRRQLSPFSIP